MVVAQKKRQQSCGDGEKSGLPHVIAQRRCDGFAHLGGRVRDHFDLSFLPSVRRIFSAPFTSSRVSLPDSMRCAMTGCVLPPNNASRSSTNLRCAASRETAASKT